MQGRTPQEVSKVIQRGRDAYRDLSIVEKKMDRLKKEMHEAIDNTTSLQDAERRNLWQACKIADKVLEYLTTDIMEGEHAIRQIEEIKKTGKPSMGEKLRQVLP